MNRTYRVRRIGLPERFGAGSWHNNILIMCIAAAVMIAFASIVYEHTFNFDVWYMLATGREILQNGIPYDNPFAQQDGMQIIVQQWMLCVLNYLIYSITGFAGLAWWTLLMALMLMVSLYRLGRLKKKDTFGGEILAVLAIPALMCMASYITMCSSVYSMIAYVWVVFFCEKYRQTEKYRWLVYLLPLAVVHSGFHMSFAIFDLVIVFCYMIPDVLRPFHKRGHLKGIAFRESSYRRLPLLIAFIGVALVLCVNPYGIRGALYVVLSYGSAGYENVIPEMNPLTPAEFPLFSISMLSLAVLAVFAMGACGLRRMDLPLIILILGTVVMAFQHQRSIWLPVIFCYALIAGSITGWSWDFAKVARWRDSAYAKAFRATNAVAGAIICAAALAWSLHMIIAVYMPTIAQAEKSDEYSPTGIMSQIVREAGDEDIKILNPIRLGGFIEWVGYKPYIDSRLEIWNSSINGVGEDYYNEYVDMTKGYWTDEEFQEFLDENDFDYLIVERDSAVEEYLKDAQGYRNAMGTDFYSLWRRTS